MKKAIALFACLLLLGTAASANSGPAYWEQAPSFSMTAIKDSPVTVEQEDLTFDFQSSNQSGDYSPNTKVTAAYRMKNPTPSGLRVQMAFPLIGRLSDLLSSDGVRITADGKDILFQVFIGDKAAGNGASRNYYREDGTLNAKNLSFDQILKSVNDNAAPLQILKDSGKLYRFSIGGRPCRLQVNFEIDPKKTAILCSGLDGFSFDKSGNGKIKLTGSVSDGATPPLEFLAVGDDIRNLTVNAYAEGSDTEKAPGVTPKTETSTQDTGAFIKGILQGNSEFAAKLIPAIERQLDTQISAGQIVVSNSMLYDLCQESHIIVLAYEIPFAANSFSNVSVHYPMGGAMNAQIASKPVYSYGYLLNPAKGWAEFKNLNITILPPKESPFITKSSIPLTRADNGTYSAKLNSLPKNDLTFTIYAKPQIIPDDKPAGKKDDRAMKFLLVLAYAAVIVLMIVFLAKLRKRKLKQ